MSLPGPLSVFINASAVSLACFVLNAQTGSIALSPFQMLSPSGSSWLLFPLCSALTLYPLEQFSAVQFVLLFISQLLQFGFAEDPQTVVP